MRLALTRSPSPRLAECELTHLPRSAIDVDVATQQHEAYCQALERLGCVVEALPPEPDMPDGIFVEDTAVIVDEVAIIARPQAMSRRGETASVEAALGPHRSIVRIADPGTLDGGDVTVIGRTILVGLSQRTNEAAVTQLRETLTPHGYDVRPVPVTGCLHLKSACTAIAADLLAVTPGWLDTDALRVAAPGVRWLDVDPGEPRGANHVLVGDAVLSPASCPRTVDRIRDVGITVEVVDVSELEKAESGVTCSSLIFEPRPDRL